MAETFDLIAAVAEWQAAHAHQWDERTGYCRRCGQRPADASVLCPAQANVQAISHYVRHHEPRPA